MAIDEHHPTRHPIGSQAFFEALVTTAISPFVVIDSELVLRFASEGAEHMLGYQRKDWVGRSIAEMMTPESAEIATIGLIDLFEAPIDLEWAGAPVRLKLYCADGTIIPVEAEALSPDRSGIDGIVVQLHRAGSTQTMSDAIDAILEGHRPEKALLLLSSLIEHDIPGTSAVLVSGWNGERFDRISGHAADLAFDRIRPADRIAVQRALNTRREVVDLFPFLDPATQAEARAAGMQSCWLSPVRVSATAAPTAALIVWNTTVGSPGALYRSEIRRSVTLARLALQWLDQQRLLAWDASHDRLTGLTNRSEFQNQLESRDGKARAVLYCDLDDFKPVNDRFGHRVGDQVLAAVAGRLRSTAGPHLVARLGGDEFAILVHPMRDTNHPVELAVDILAALRQPVSTLGFLADVGVSVGVAIDEGGIAGADHLLDEADRLLREGKALGKNQLRTVHVTASLD